MKNYETIFILNPVLSENQMKNVVEKFKKILIDNKAEIINEENWGLKKLAYPIQHKRTGFYQIFEYACEPTLIDIFETEFKREETIIRFLTTALDKHGLAYNLKRKSGAFNKTKKEGKEDKAA